MGGTLRRRVAPVPMTMSTPAEGAPGGWRTLNNSRMRVGDHEARPSAQGVYVLSRYYRLERL
jgi:hypothetical protein